MEASHWFSIIDISHLSNRSDKTLDDFNDEESLRRLAPLIYLGVLMIIGVIGNTIVLIVYPLRFPRNTHRTFIVGLALSDLLVCLFTIPFEFVEMRFQYTFYNKIACKIFRSLSYWLSLASMCILIGMSYEKYRRICRPMKKQVTVKVCRLYIICVFATSLVCAWPNLLLSGIRLVKLSNNVTGHDCSMSDKYSHTIFPPIAEGALLFISVTCIIVITILYSLIGQMVLKQNRYRQQFQSRYNSHEVNANIKDFKISTISNNTERFKTEPTSRRKNKTLIKNQQRSVRKLTKIAFVISVVFILSYLPHLILSLLTAIKGQFLLKPGPVVSAVLPIIARSFLINNVVNPIIYGFFDARFRQNCKVLFFMMLLCGRRSSGVS